MLKLFFLVLMLTTLAVLILKSFERLKTGLHDLNYCDIISSLLISSMGSIIVVWLITALADYGFNRNVLSSKQLEGSKLLFKGCTFRFWIRFLCPTEIYGLFFVLSILDLTTGLSPWYEILWGFWVIEDTVTFGFFFFILFKNVLMDDTNGGYPLIPFSFSYSDLKLSKDARFLCCLLCFTDPMVE
jgi:hypothetical protein